MQSSKVGGASHQEVATRLVCSAGLAEMEFGKYKNAARLLTKASIEHCKFQDVGLSRYNYSGTSHLRQPGTIDLRGLK